ncbi:MAG: hypothetical protein OHK0022_53080 [Roseiflexaceae bacterium]
MKQRIVGCAVLAGVILLLVCGLPPVRGAAAPPRPDKGASCGGTTLHAMPLASSGAINGVVQAANQKPLGGATVLACQQPPPSGGVGKVFQTTTKPDGSYGFVGLEPGGYLVLFVDPSGAHGYRYWNSVGQNAPSTSYASLLTLAGGETQSGISAVLAPAGQISGVVSNRRGDRLAGIRVSIEIQDLSGLYESVPISPTITGLDGSYALAGLPTSDRYRLTFEDPQSRYRSALLQARTAAGDINPTGDITLAQTGGDIIGRVTKLDGAPLPGVLVMPYRSVAGGWEAVPATAERTDANGIYRLFNLPPGSYRVGFRDPSGRSLPEFYPDAPDPASASDIVVGAETTTREINAELAPARLVFLPLVRR